MLPGQGTGFTSIDQFLDANQGTLAREGSDIGGQIGGDIEAARGAADSLISGRTSVPEDPTAFPGYKDALDKAIAAKDETTALGSPGGISDRFQKQFHDTRSQGDFDASLLGASGRLDVPGLQGRANDLIEHLNHGLAAPIAPTTPTRQPDGPERLPPGSYPGTQPATPGTYPPTDERRHIPGGR